MHCLCLRLHQFFSNEFKKSYPHDGCVIVRDGVVLDASSRFIKSGVLLGMTLRQAKAIAHNAQFIPWIQEQYESASRRWLDRCLIFSHIIEPDGQDAAYIDLSAHPRPDEIALRLVDEIERRTGLHVSWGMASSKLVARLAADIHGSLIVRQARTFLCDVPTRSLAPISPEHRNRLEVLGCLTAGQVAQLPLSVLQAEFSGAGIKIKQVVEGVYGEPVRALYPLDSTAESLIFDGAVSSLQQIEEGLKVLADRLGANLKAKEQQGGELRAFIELDSGEIITLRRKFVKPIRDERTVFVALKLLLSDRLNTPIVRISALLSNLEHSPHIQRQLLGQSKPAGADNALRYIRSRYGEKAVQRASEMHLARRLRVLKEWRDATGWR